MATEPIALQLYTVRALIANDYMGTLQKLADGGLQAVEFAGWGTFDAVEMRKNLDRMGLVTAGAHVGFQFWDEAPDKAIADLHALGAEYAAIPWLAPEMRPTTMDQVKFLTDKFAVWADKAKAGGIRLGYHNHDFEFLVVDGKTAYDRIAESTGLDLQLDVYWAEYTGTDALALIRKYAGRMPQLHVKDLATKADGTKRDAPFGEGEIDWDEIIPVAAESGTKWYIIEQDTPDDPLGDSIKGLNNARATLKKLGIL